jgi:F-type H+-transporting ATPase subunit gamma
MASLKDIRRRIGSTTSTQKITRAMKLVAAAKLRRAQDNIQDARPYAVKLHELISELGLRAEQQDHPLLAHREPRRVMLVVLTSNRGLCGAFNTNILRAAETFLEENKDRYEELLLTVVGRKGRDYLQYRNVKIDRYYDGLDVKTAEGQARKISAGILEEFLAEDLDMVSVIYNEFKSAMSQQIVVEQLLPIVPLEVDEQVEAPVDFIYEPNKDHILETILPLYVHVELMRAALESTASEYGARMTAMENATNSANDLIAALTLEYNKARQTAITTELLEIVAGAEALKN